MWFIALFCSVLHSLHFMILHCNCILFSTLHWILINCILLHCTLVQQAVLHSTHRMISKHCILLHCINCITLHSVYCIALHCTACILCCSMLSLFLLLYALWAVKIVLIRKVLMDFCYYDCIVVYYIIHWYSMSSLPSAPCRFWKISERVSSLMFNLPCGWAANHNTNDSDSFF